MSFGNINSVQTASILIVDDNPTNIKVLFDILKQSDFRVSVAKSGESALVKVQEALPDLILLDVMMPGVDGFDTCRRLKANPKTQEIPIIFLSALDEVTDKVKAFTVGGVDYITKPFQTEEVLVRVENQLALHAAKAEICKLNVELEQRVQQRTTQLEAANQELEQEIEQFRLTFELAPIGMAINTLDGRFVRVNQALCNTLGYTKQELLNQTWADVTYPDDLAVTLALNQKLCQEEIFDFQTENRYKAKDGRVVYGILQVALVRDSRGLPLHLISQFMDITARKQAEEQLRYGALHDDLTNLPNRTLLIERLELALRRAKRASNFPAGDRLETTAAHKDYLFAVLFIDLDRFKVVNDSLGHQVGDQLLVAIARELETFVRSTDTVARLGGDEFIILLDPIKDINDAIQVASRICRELRAPFHLEGREVFTTASIGIALSSPDYNQGSELLRNADIAMYRAKEKGSLARYEVFDQVMYAQALEQLQLENDLRQALERQEFQVYYQPIVSLITGRLTGFEALVRWQHPVRGKVSPAEFIPIAEETGLIVPIGEWVLREAAQQMSVWRTQFSIAKPLKISVNLSVKQLKEPNFIEKIDSILAQTGLEGQSLQLELTESMLMDNVEELIGILSLLRARAIQLSIDDFGTGYSSLSYLHRFPVNNLKIDRCFVSRIGEKGENREIVETIVTLAHQLDMEVIAEGVETLQQLNQLKELTCEEVQGYLFSKPLERESAEALIAANHTFSQFSVVSQKHTQSDRTFAISN